MPDLLPHYAKTIIVPVANPDTAPAMLELAVSLVEPEKGRVIATTVALGDDEQINRVLAEITPIVQGFTAQGHKIEMRTQMATSISRGILEAVRESGADMLIMGVQRPERRQVRLGTVVENVIQAAPCDVLVYRLGDDPTYKRVLVPLDGSAESANALNAAVMIAKTHQSHIVPLYIQRDYVYRSDREEQIREALDMMEPGTVDQEVIPGRSPADMILNELSVDDLLVLGFSHKSDFEMLLENDLAKLLLNRAPGPTLLVSRSQRNAVSRSLQRFSPMLTPVERNEVIWQAQKMALGNIDFWMMILFSAGLASFGLLQSSVAVIIGAMLVAPLMSPLGGLAVGMASGQSVLVQRGTLTLIQGVGLALMLAFLIGWLLPVAPTSEMLARGNPTLLDAGVALMSGFVAAYAIARKDIPAALAGVAIAAALMPPVCTVGLGAALGNWDLAFGALLLFVTNVVCIVVAQTSIFLWLGIRPIAGLSHPIWTRLWWILASSLLAIVMTLLYRSSHL